MLTYVFLSFNSKSKTFAQNRTNLNLNIIDDIGYTTMNFTSSFPPEPISSGILPVVVIVLLIKPVLHTSSTRLRATDIMKLLLISSAKTISCYSKWRLKRTDPGPHCWKKTSSPRVFPSQDSHVVVVKISRHCHSKWLLDWMELKFLKWPET